MLDVRANALIAIVVLTVLTSALAMCMRQLRHLSEVPADFGWMPLYIVFSTLVLMPIRIYGFIRLGHVGGWGTRAHAFGAEQSAEATDRTLEEELDALVLAEEAASTGRHHDEFGSGRSVANPSRLRLVTVVPQPAAPAPEAETTDGDPRGLIPYAIAIAVLIAGVVYDVLPV
jgi:hyaluronan synthase